MKLEILALCNYADYSRSGSFNLVGVFDQITASSFPASFSRGFIALTVTGIKPNSIVPAEVKIIDPSKEVVLNQKFDLIPGENKKSNFFIEVLNLSLSVPGRYIVSVIVKNKEIGNTALDVIKLNNNGK